MDQDRREIHIDSNAARGGSTPHIVRWVLAISLLLAIVVMSLVWIIPALNQGDVEEEITASGIADSTASGSSTDGIVSDNADEMTTSVEDSAVGTVQN